MLDGWVVSNLGVVRRVFRTDALQIGSDSDKGLPGPQSLFGTVAARLNVGIRIVSKAAIVVTELHLSQCKAMLQSELRYSTAPGTATFRCTSSVSVIVGRFSLATCDFTGASTRDRLDWEDYSDNIRSLKSHIASCRLYCRMFLPLTRYDVSWQGDDDDDMILGLLH